MALSKAEAARLNGKKGGRPRKNRETAAPDASVQQTAQAAVPPVDNPHGLTPKELLFVECYCGVSKFNASDAYKRAGYKPNRHNAARLITKETVAQALSARLATRVQTAIMDGDEALQGISRIARADIRKVLTPSGNVKPIDQLDDDTADAIASIKVVEKRVPQGDGEFEIEYTKEFKFYDKLDARKTMAKAAGRLTEKHEHKIVRGLDDILAEVAALEQQEAATVQEAATA